MKRIKKLGFEDRLIRLNKAAKQVLKKTILEKQRIHVVYVVGNTEICGATRIIFEHANRLMLLGVRVSVVTYLKKPLWFELKAEHIEVSEEFSLAGFIPRCDVIIATYYTHIQECIETGIAPVIYFEQGDLHLFEFNKLDVSFKRFVYHQYQLPMFIMTVSEPAAKLIKELFKRNAKVIRNGIDLNVFKSIISKKKTKQYILMVGRDDISFKGNQNIINAYDKIKGLYPELELYWATPYISDKSLKDRVNKLYLMPSSKKLVYLYQNASLFISASRYETFSLPVLEAMACGCPVLSADNIGIHTYAEDNYNILLYKQDDLLHMISKIKEILDDEALREALKKNGLKTAEENGWGKNVEELYDFLYQAAQYETIKEKVIKAIKTEKIPKYITRDINDKISKEGTIVEVIYDYAYQLYENNLQDEALYFFKEFIRAQKEISEKKKDAKFMCFEIYLKKGLYKKARQEVLEFFEYEIPSPKECCFIGLTFFKEKRWEQAAFWYDRALKTPKPDNYSKGDEADWTWKPHLQLSVCYYQIKDVDKALEHHKRAYEINPENENIIYNEDFFKKYFHS